MGRHCRILILFALVVAAGCAEGRDLNAKKARIYFGKHRGGLETLVAQVTRCRPVGEAGYDVIWARVDAYTTPIRCARGGEQQIAEIRRGLRREGLLAVGASFSSEQPEAISEVRFVLYRDGLAVSGRLISLTFVSKAGFRSSQHPNYDVEALTATPAHWFWSESR